MIKVRSEMGIYEVDGKDVKEYPPPKLVVESHWNCPDRVVLCIHDERYTVIVRDLEAAIHNAANSNRH